MVQNQSMRTGILALCLTIASGFAAAAPPPPPPEYIYHIAVELAYNQTPATFESYSARFANDLKVFVDGIEIANDKKSWLSIERARLGNVNRRVIGYSLGQDNILMFDQFDDITYCRKNPGFLCDPRAITRAARYHFGSDHLIHEVRFLQGGYFMLQSPLTMAVPELLTR